MNKYNHPIIKIMFKLPYIFCVKDDEIEVFNDVPEDKIKNILELAKANQITVRFILRDTECPECNKPLHRNGTDSPFLNKDLYVKSQNYCHRKCKTTKYTRLYKYKDKYCNYMNYIRYNGLTRILLVIIHITPSKDIYTIITKFMFRYQQYILMINIHLKNIMKNLENYKKNLWKN